MEATGNPIEFPCAAGTYLNIIGAEKSTDCIICPAGNYCLEGTGDYASIQLKTYPLANPIMNCNPGFYCPDGSPSGNIFPCKPGTYSTANNLKAENECTDCPAGMYYQI